MYALLLRLLGVAVDLFYRRQHLGGTIPPTGPCILVANHPNGLIDPIVVARVAGRPVRMLAKAPLFAMPGISWLVKTAGALPVYRSQDGADTTQNHSTFSAVFDALHRGECIALFPEGISHHEPQLQPLKTGAARMALGASEVLGFAVDIPVIPIGLSYEDKHAFRSPLVTEVGEPISTSPHRAGYALDPKNATRNMTEEIDQHLRDVTLNLMRWEDRPLLVLAEQLWGLQPEAAHPKRLQALASGAQVLRQQDPAQFEMLREQVSRFRRRLAAVGVDATHLDGPKSHGAVLRFLLRNLAALLVGLPVAMVGAVTYLVPYLVVRLLPRPFRLEADVLSTARLGLALVVFPLWHVGVIVGLWLHMSPLLAFPCGLVLPLCGLYAARYQQKRTQAWRQTWAFLLQFVGGKTLLILIEERRELSDALDAVARRLAES